MVRFLHSSDWQLGMTRRFLTDEAQARYTQARFDAIRTMGQIAHETRCEFLLVCGDVFESNRVERKTVRKALDVLGSLAVPTILLPGNHDPLDPGTLYRGSVFTQQKPPNVRVLESSRPVEVCPGVEIVGAPWPSKKPGRDLVADVLRELEPQQGSIRICAAHGPADRLAPGLGNLATIDIANAESALADGRIHFLALGDRHSLTRVGSTGRIWYSGTPEATDYDEEDPGHVLVVEIDGPEVRTTPYKVGRWWFHRQRIELHGDADLDRLESAIRECEAKEHAQWKLGLVGTLSLRQQERLQVIWAQAADLLGGIERWPRETDLAVIPAESDFAELEVSGFARSTVDELRSLATGNGDSASTARDALCLLTRLTRRN
jgi:DNA repair exonuclease SbcCD nuclease subunit